MIQRISRYILTFYSTSGAIAVEKYCKKHDIAGRLIPVPRQISASCGLSWAVPYEDREVLSIVERQFKDEIEGHYEVTI